ncbi:hypothetical protein [Bradyrhizobium elkanii]
MSARYAFKIGFRDGREQGFAESYRLYVSDERAPCAQKKEKIESSVL